MNEIFDKTPMKILKGIVISIILTFILLLIYAALLTYTELGENTIEPVVIGITAVSIFIRKRNCRKRHKKEWYNKSEA